MNKITSIAELKSSIHELENQQANDKALMIEEFKLTYENLKPINLIKNKINDIVKDPDLKENILDATMSIAAGYLSKKMIIGSTHNPIKQLFGTLLQVGITTLVSKNSDSIKSTVLNLVGNLLHKKNETHQ